MVVCAGQCISYHVPIQGSPKPLVKWSINNMVVTSNEHIDITTTRRQTTLDIQFSERSDAGKYTLEVSNELGSAVARATVKVLDRPAPPDGPLRLSGNSNLHILSVAVIFIFFSVKCQVFHPTFYMD